MSRHALVDMSTGLVKNIIIWEGAEFVPPRGHYVIHDCEGQIGDYWDQNNNAFYTYNGKRRFKDAQGKCGEKELTQDENERIKPHLDKVYQYMKAPMEDATLAIEKKEQ